jgi:hypothetical protein
VSSSPSAVFSSMFTFSIQNTFPVQLAPQTQLLFPHKETTLSTDVLTRSHIGHRMIHNVSDTVCVWLIIALLLQYIVTLSLCLTAIYSQMTRIHWHEFHLFILRLTYTYLQQVGMHNQEHNLNVSSPTNVKTTKEGEAECHSGAQAAGATMVTVSVVTWT